MPRHPLDDEGADHDRRNDEAGDAQLKPAGEGTEGTIPPNPDGLAANLGGEGSNFNPEEDPEADTTEAGS